MNNLNLPNGTKLYLQWPSTVHNIYTQLVAFASSIHYNYLGPFISVVNLNLTFPMNNRNRTERSPTQSVIVRVIN